MTAREEYNIISSAVLNLAAIVFAYLGVMLPPEGVIDNSVLILIAQLLIAAATYVNHALTFVDMFKRKSTTKSKKLTYYGK